MTEPKAPHYEGEVVPVLDLWELLSTGKSGGLVLGETGPDAVQALLGAPVEERNRDPAEGDTPLWTQEFSESFPVNLAYDRRDRLCRVEVGSSTSPLFTSKPPDGARGLVDLHVGDGVVRFDGYCLTHFATLPRLIERIPPNAAAEYEAASWDRAIRIGITRAGRRLSLIYRLQVLETDDRGRFDADYFLDRCSVSLAALPS